MDIEEPEADHMIMDTEESDQMLMDTGTEESEQKLVEQVFAYISSGGLYQGECTENRKRVIRRKAGKFVLSDGEFLYRQKVKGKVKSDKFLHAFIDYL